MTRHSYTEPTIGGHRRRLRNRFLRGGRVALADYELLELLLTYALPRIDTKPLARELIDRFGTLGTVLQKEPAELGRIQGIGLHAAGLIRLIRDIWLQAMEETVRDGARITSPEDVALYVRSSVGHRDRECVQLLCLNAANRMVHQEILAEGTVNQAPVYPREVARLALATGATAVILVHNHPGGQCRPSADDLELTRRIEEILAQLGIHLHDHLIVTTRHVYSITAGRIITTPTGE